MSSSSTWDSQPPYTNNPGNNNPTSGISPIVAHSNGPGGGIVQQQQPGGEAPRAIHQPSPTYSSAGPPPYLHHPPPYSHTLPPGPNPYPPGGTPVIHPYPPPTTTTVSNPVGPYHPPPHSHYPAPPPPYAAPVQLQHGHSSPHLPISPTHTTASIHHSQQQQQLPPGAGVGVPPSHHHLGGGAPPLTVGPPPPPHHGPYNLKVNPNVSQQPGLPPPHPSGLGPVPQTPLGPPVGGNPFGASGPELDLHPELVAIGWRKFWSKRESRWYFWNCNSGESLWELPPLPGRHPPPPGHSGGGVSLVCIYD